jgi:protein disulfide-isomerase
MRKIIFSVLGAALLSAWTVNAADTVWFTDMSAAKAQAKAENKLMLMDFTGSDWCPWCIRFKKDVLDTPEFQAYAAKHVVEVEVDFPDKKAQGSDLKKSNAALKDKYDVQGFPTLVVLDANGKEIGRQVGYDEGGPKAFIAKLEGYKAAK